MKKINLHLEKQNKQAKEPTKNWQLNQTKAQWHHPSPPVAASPSPPLHETQSGAATTTRNPLLKKQIAYISTPLRASPPSDLPQIQASRSPNTRASPHGTLAGAGGRVGPRPLATAASASPAPVVGRRGDLVAARRRLQLLERCASILPDGLVPLAQWAV